MSDGAGTAVDVLVIGAGPAGALAAHELARRGLRVLLVDKARFPRDKACGSILHPQGLAVLEACGLGAVMARAVAAGDAAPVHSAEVVWGTRRATVALSGSLAIRRDRLDWALVQAAAECGAEVRDGTLATLCDRRQVGARRVVRLRSADRDIVVEAAAVVVADGLNGMLAGATATARRPRIQRRARYVGAAWTAAGAPDWAASGGLVMACGRGGYVGGVRLADGRLHLACALRPEAARRAGGVARLAAEILADARLPVVPGLLDGRWLGTGAFPSAAPAIAAPRLLGIGDAASFEEPFTGQGISWALRSAQEVAPLAAAAARRWSDDLIPAWEKAHAEAVGRRQRACRRLGWVLRRPTLARRAVLAVAMFPALAAPLVRSLTR